MIYMLTLNKDLIIFCENMNNKERILTKITSLLYRKNYINNKKDFVKKVIEREKAGSTYIGNNVAIPHGESKSVKTNCLVILKSRLPINWDGYVVHVIALFSIHPNINQIEKENYKRYIQAIGDENFVNKLKNTNDKEKIVMLFEND
ncbi:MAG: PTS sugar transporter subunit IIA [Virgibacillus sp.]|nr:PTS sugar transporter subunit IIA [Virgibacillus sp.]